VVAEVQVEEQTVQVVQELAAAAEEETLNHHQ
jgi:hypothetical protein